MCVRVGNAMHVCSCFPVGECLLMVYEKMGMCVCMGEARGRAELCVCSCMGALCICRGWGTVHACVCTLVCLCVCLGVVWYFGMYSDVCVCACVRACVFVSVCASVHVYL